MVRHIHRNADTYDLVGGREHVLCGFDTTLEQDLDRIYTLRDLGYAPYVMIYDKYKLKKRDQLKRMQRWVNSRYAFMACERFEDYTG